MEDWIALAIRSSKEMAAASPVERGGADAEFVKRSYEEHWGRRIEGIRKKIAAGETVAHILANIRSQPHLVQANRVAEAITKNLLADFNETTSAGKPTSRLGACGSRFVAQPNFDPMSAIYQHALSADVIVELGAGPGWNLFNLSTYLGKAIQRKRLFGLEFSDAGLEIIKILAEHENLPIEAHFFDYRNPDLSMLPETGRLLIFSHHSLEQVEEISPLLHQKIATRPEPTKLIHCEPIGWQRFPELYKARVRQNDDLFKAMVVRRFDDLHAPHAVAMCAAINSWRAKYNRNAMDCVNKHVNAKRFVVREAIYDFTHVYNSNPVNPSTYLEIDVISPGAAVP
ncbi:class I SAM-dependent methyltransferase [Mesorhizobium sp. WSM2239]